MTYLLFVLAGISSFYELEMLGRLPIAECFVIFIASSGIIYKLNVLTGKYSLTIIALCMAWFLTQFATDIYMGVARVDTLKSIAGIVLFTLAIAGCITIWSWNSSWLFAFVIGIVVGRAIQVVYFPIGAVQENWPWKFGLGLCFMVLVAAAVDILGKRRKISLLVAIIGISMIVVISLRQDSRSLTLIAIVSLLIWLFLHIRSRALSSSALLPGHFKRLVVLAVLALPLGGTAAYFIYSELAEGGFLGIDIQNKFWYQSRNQYGLVLSGRSEYFGSVPAILDSPIFGYGSTKYGPEYAAARTQMLQQTELLDLMPADLVEIPTHSFLMDSWVKSGIVGAILWLFILFLNIMSLSRMADTSLRWSFVFIVLTVNLIWNVFFSPFGTDHRLLAAATVAISVGIMRSPRSRPGNSVGAAQSSGEAAERVRGISTA